MRADIHAFVLALEEYFLSFVWRTDIMCIREGLDESVFSRGPCRIISGLNTMKVYSMFRREEIL